MTEQQFGPYRLVSLLGRGGMGEVWRAVDTRKQRTVALKVLGSWLGGDPQFAERFRRESDLAARLNSPHIVPIHDYGEIDGRLFIDMPMVDGPDLATLIDHGPLPPARAVDIVTQAARALAVAHRAGLVHRDVKPSNILVSSIDGEDHAYLIDFGITKSLDGTRLSLSGSVVGTAAYMAPECFTGVGDPRSDVYSLGCVLYEALTAQPPFGAPHAFAYAHLHQTAPPPRPSVVRPGVPPGLDAVVARALNKSPAGRFPTALEFAAAARAALSAPPVAAARPTAVTEIPPGPAFRPPAPAFYATPPPAAPPARPRRGRWLLAAVLAALVLVVAGVVALRPSGSSIAGISSQPPTSTAAPPTTAPPAASAAPPLTLTGHTGPVQAVTTAQLDGRPVALSASEDKTVRVWDLSDGKQVGQPLTGHTDYALAVATAQLDGRPVAVTGGGDNTVRLWDLTTDQEIGEPLTGHSDYVRALAITQLGGRAVAVTCSDDKTVRIWDLTTGQQIGQPLTGHTDTVYGMATGQLGGRPVAVSSSKDTTLRVWDLTTGQPIGQPLTGHTDTVYGVATTQLEGRPVAVSAGADNTVRIWDLDSRQELGQPLTGHTDAAYTIDVTDLDGRPVAVSGSRDQSVRTWDLLTGAGL